MIGNIWGVLGVEFFESRKKWVGYVRWICNEKGGK